MARTRRPPLAALFSLERSLVPQPLVIVDVRARRTRARPVERNNVRLTCSKVSGPNSATCNLVLSSSPAFLRFWFSEGCRDSFLSHIAKEDLSSFRLVCHDFKARAAPHLFEELSVTFKASTFTKPSRVFALDRIGRHVKTLTFSIPHTNQTFLPPLINPMTGEELPFVYEPQVQAPRKGSRDASEDRYGSFELADALVKQYPPLFHAATNVPSFIRAFNSLPNLSHLKISCPGQEQCMRYRRSVVDYALISLRIAVERASLRDLDTLSLLPIHPAGLFYLQPQMSIGASPGALRRWSQIKKLAVHMDSFPFDNAHPTSHLRILHSYLRAFAPHLTRLLFRWRGDMGPSPFSLDREPCMYERPSSSSSSSSSGSDSTSANSCRMPRPLKFPKLRFMELENAIMDSCQVSDFIQRHRRLLTEFNFEDVKLRTGTWDDALAPLSRLAHGDAWKAKQEEVMDVPCLLSPVDVEPRILGPLLEEQRDEKERGGVTLSRWLSKSKNNKARKVAREQFWGSDGHMRRFLRSSVFPWR